MGIFFAVAQILIFSALLFDPSTRQFLLWSCNNFCILLVIACYRKDIQMIMGISYLGLLSQIVWVLDFVSHILGFNLSGVTDYIYIEGFTYANDVSIAVHIIVPTVILMFSFRVKPRLRSLLFAIPYILFLYVATLIVAPTIEDINCVFKACGNDVYLPYNIYLWPLYAFISTLISYGIHYLLYYGWGSAVVSLRRRPAK
jgi:hypothetical protein